MGHKTHPLGFRLGVKPRGPITRGLAYHPDEDLHGSASRWCSATKEESGSWTLRDYRIRTSLRSWLLDDGYLRNKCILHRGPTQLGIYLDAYQVVDRGLLEPLVGLKESLPDLEEEAPAGPSSAASAASEASPAPLASAGPLASPASAGSPVAGEGLVESSWARLRAHSHRERLLSRREGGRPVSLQFYCLNSRLRELPADYWSGRERVKAKSQFLEDRQNLSTLLAVAPTASLYARGLGARLTQERHKVTLRAASDVRKQVARSGLRRRERLDGEWVMSEPVVAGRGGFLGYRLQVKGRIGGSERKRVQVFQEGVRPRGTRSSPLDYGFGEADTASGLVSVKRWVCYG